MIKKNTKLILGILPGIIAYIVSTISNNYPDIVEKVYSRGIYPVLTYISYLNSFIPISTTELTLYALGLFIVLYFIFIFSALLKKGKIKFYYFTRRLLYLLTAISCAVSIFIFGWSLNYSRNTLSKNMELDVQPATVEELIDTCEKLVSEANINRKQVCVNDEGIYKLSRSQKEILKDVKLQFKKHAPDFMNIGSDTNVKGVLTDNLLSITQTTGIFSPFTYECHVNTDMPDLYFASTAVHEYSHFKGFAREDECNFIAWYITRNSDDVDFKYSGSVLALVHAMNGLYTESKEEYFRIYEMIDDGIKIDWAAESLYWENFETDFAQNTNEVYNAYLQSNHVSDGTKSYGRMVDLIIAMNRKGYL